MHETKMIRLQVSGVGRQASGAHPSGTASQPWRTSDACCLSPAALELTRRTVCY